MRGKHRRADRQKAIRAKIKAQKHDRKVWLLPAELVERIIEYQEERLLPSEVAAARDLLDSGLRSRGF